MASTITELLSVRQITQGSFESAHSPEEGQTALRLFETVYNPEKMGSLLDIAYGGNTLAVAVNAALQTIPSGYFLYYALGNYLGPALTDRTLQCTVRDIRTTKTFATRHVEVSQIPKDGKRRLCLFLSADFQTAEPATLLTYSRPPMTSHSAVEDCPTEDENRQGILNRGLASELIVQSHKKIFGLHQRFFDRRHCPEGITAQTLTGMAKKGTATTQDHLPLPARTSSDYIRSKHPLETPAQHAAALAFLMDMGTSSMPVVHSGRSLDQVQTQSSLEFALRIFTNDLDLNAWSLREFSTVTGGAGRTYTESQTWDSSGKMMCCMTEQCILRPKL